MKYPAQEKRSSMKKKFKEERKLQAKKYCDAESFEEYAVSCEVDGISRKYKYFIFDPFWIFYVCENSGYCTILLSVMGSAFVIFSLLCGIMTFILRLNLIAFSLLEAAAFIMTIFVSLVVPNCYREAKRWVFEVL